MMYRQRFMQSSNMLPPERRNECKEQTSHVDRLIQSNHHKEPMTLILLPEIRSAAGCHCVNAPMVGCINYSILPSNKQEGNPVGRCMNGKPLERMGLIQRHPVGL